VAFPEGSRSPDGVLQPFKRGARARAPAATRLAATRRAAHPPCSLCAPSLWRTPPAARPLAAQPANPAPCCGRPLSKWPHPSPSPTPDPSPTPNPGPFKMAMRAGVPVVPVTISDLARWYPKGTLLPIGVPTDVVVTIHPYAAHICLTGLEPEP
jgi:hypothetical protein